MKFSGFDALTARITAVPGGRVIVAVAGPPGSGKSTLAAALADCLNLDTTDSAVVIPMDGFHYDDAVLEARGLLSRKGSPPTFDVGGFHNLLARLRACDETEVAVPVFDRSLEISRAGARIVPGGVRYLVVEGSYLLFADAPWADLAPYFDVTVMVTETRDRLEERLIHRWLSYGLDEAAAREKVRINDLPNVDLVQSHSRSSELTVSPITIDQKEISRP